MNSSRNFQFSLVKTQFFSRGASPSEPPSKESKQSYDNIACFYNLTLPIFRSDEIFNVIICEFLGTSGGSGRRSPPVAEGEKILRVNKTPPLDKENFQVVRGGFLLNDPVYKILDTMLQREEEKQSSFSYRVVH